MVEDVRIIDDRVDNGDLVLETRKAEVVDGARIKIAAIADAGQIKLGNGFRRQAKKRAQRILVLGQPVIREEIVVREQHAVPAPHPFVIQRELALGVDATAELTIPGLTGEGSGVQLVDAVGADLIRPVDQALTEFALQQHALPGCEAWGEGRVVVGSDRPVERRLNGIAVGRGLREARHQEPGLALHGRIGRRKIRQIRHWNAEELQLRVLEIQHLVGLVVNDARALDLP